MHTIRNDINSMIDLCCKQLNEDLTIDFIKIQRKEFNVSRQEIDSAKIFSIKSGIRGRLDDIPPYYVRSKRQAIVFIIKELRNLFISLGSHNNNEESRFLSSAKEFKESLDSRIKNTDDALIDLFSKNMEKSKEEYFMISFDVYQFKCTCMQFTEILNLSNINYDNLATTFKTMSATKQMNLIDKLMPEFKHKRIYSPSM